MTHREAALFVTKQALEIAKDLPVVGSLVKPIYTVFVKVLAACDEVQGCREAMVCIEERILQVQNILIREPDGLALIVQKKPELTSKLNDSVQILQTKYDEIVNVLEPLKKKKTFWKLFSSNAAKIKEDLENLDASIVAELKKLSLALQISSFSLQTQTFAIVTDLQDKITNLYGGQEGLLHNEAAMNEVAQSIGMDVSDLRSSISDYLAEMQQTLMCHGTEQADRVITHVDGLRQEIIRLQQMVFPSSAGGTNGKGAAACSDPLSEISLKDKLVIYEEIILGKGQFGKVLKGVYQGQDVAVKVIKISVLAELGPAAVQDMNKEIIIHHRLCSVPGVVKLIGVDLTNPELPKAVLELAEGKIDVHAWLLPFSVDLDAYPPIIKLFSLGSLHEALYHSAGNVALSQVVRDLTWRLDVLRQICQALYYMHHIDFLHRDIKPLNVLLFPSDIVLSDGTRRHGAVVKLADFGFARGVDNRSVGLLQPKGTPHYMAPEVFEATYSKASDVYALAVLMNEVLAEAPPYQDQEHAASLNLVQLSHAVREVLRPTLFSKAHTVVASQLVQLSRSGAEYSDLVAGLEHAINRGWSKQPTSRGTVEQIYRDLNRLFEGYQHVCKYGRSKPSMRPANAGSTAVADVILPHVLVQREVQGIESLILFLRKECKLMPKVAQEYAKNLVTAMGIYNVDMLVSLVNKGRSNALSAIVSSPANLRMISSAAAERKGIMIVKAIDSLEVRSLLVYCMYLTLSTFVSL